MLMFNNYILVKIIKNYVVLYEMSDKLYKL